MSDFIYSRPGVYYTRFNGDNSQPAELGEYHVYDLPTDDKEFES